MFQLVTYKPDEAIIHARFRLTIIGLWSMIGNDDYEAI